MGGARAHECETDIRNYKLYSKHKDTNNSVLQSLYVDCENTILRKLREQYHCKTGCDVQQFKICVVLWRFTFIDGAMV